MTIEQIAKSVGVSQQVAYGFVTFLVAQGLAKKVGTIKPPGQRGKGKNVYKIKKGTELRLAELVAPFCEGNE